MKRLLISLLFLLALPSGADDSAYVLYSLDADIDGDRTPERMVVLSYESSDPAHQGKKKLLIMKRSGDLYKTVYSDQFDGGFYTKLDPFQWQGADNAMAGVSLRKFSDQKYATVWVVFTPNSSDFLSYTYDGKTFNRDEVPDGI